MREFNLPDDFREEVLNAARAEADQFHPEVIEAPRQDLTQHTVITIDPIDARDFDDAISLTQTSAVFGDLVCILLMFRTLSDPRACSTVKHTNERRACICRIV